MMNMHVMLAAVYDGKRHGESSPSSETLAFIRSTPKFQVDGYVYTMEIKADVHHGSPQYLDDHGRAVLSVGNLKKAARAGHRLLPRLSPAEAWLEKQV